MNLRGGCEGDGAAPAGEGDGGAFTSGKAELSSGWGLGNCGLSAFSAYRSPGDKPMIFSICKRRWISLS